MSVLLTQPAFRQLLHGQNAFLRVLAAWPGGAGACRVLNPSPSPQKNPQKRKHIPSQILCPLQCLGEEDAAEVQLLLQLRKHLMGVKRAIEVRMAELRVQSFSAMSMCVLDAGPPGTSFDGSTQNCNGRIGCECRS